jgi:hypothetical protein
MALQFYVKGIEFQRRCTARGNSISLEIIVDEKRLCTLAEQVCKKYHWEQAQYNEISIAPRICQDSI